MSLMSKDSFIFRTWSYVHMHLVYSKSVSLARIVSTWAVFYTFTILTLAPTVTFLTFSFPSTLAVSTTENKNYGNAYSNITLLDLYPELKDYLWKKAVNQLSTSTVPNSSVISKTEDPYYAYSKSYGQDNAWTNDYVNNYYNGVGGAIVPPAVQIPPSPSNNYYWNSRGEPDSDPEGSYNYQKEVLKYWHPFGSPEFYDSWKFKPTPTPHLHPHVAIPSSPSKGWTSSLLPIWEEEEEETVSQELSKDFSCLAGLLGLKTLKKLKFAAIFKKVKILGIFLIAFKLGVLLSPVAIPLLFPVILLVTVVKILPLIIIIVLLLKILKKQIKIKKPFGKFLDQTSSLFFDDINTLTDKVLNSDDEYIDKITNGIGSKKSIPNKRSKIASGESRNKRVNSRNYDTNQQNITGIDL